jgi:hypothetical protein
LGEFVPRSSMPTGACRSLGDIQALLEKHVGIVYLSDVEVLRPDHF